MLVKKPMLILFSSLSIHIDCHKMTRTCAFIIKQCILSLCCKPCWWILSSGLWRECRGCNFYLYSPTFTGSSKNSVHRWINLTILRIVNESWRTALWFSGQRLLLASVDCFLLRPGFRMLTSHAKIPSSDSKRRRMLATLVDWSRIVHSVWTRLPTMSPHHVGQD